MPYITEAARVALDAYPRPSPRTPGELNYLITKLALDYSKRHPGYDGINDVVGALECTKLEFYRRRAAPYEDHKIDSNGDVY